MAKSREHRRTCQFSSQGAPRLRWLANAHESYQSCESGQALRTGFGPNFENISARIRAQSAKLTNKRSYF